LQWKEEQQAYFKDQNIQTVLGDLETDVTSVLLIQLTEYLQRFSG
jgi:hypothetical protein